MIELESARLFLREITAGDLAQTLPVYMSNAEIVQRQEGSEGEVGRYEGVLHYGSASSPYLDQ